MHPTREANPILLGLCVDLLVDELTAVAVAITVPLPARPVSVGRQVDPSFVSGAVPSFPTGQSVGRALLAPGGDTSLLLSSGLSPGVVGQ